MQGIIQKIIATVGGLILWCSAAGAEDVIAIEIADTGQILSNSASHHQINYEGDEAHLLNRIGLLMYDVDVLLARLHALPPELPRHTPDVVPAGDELAWLVDLALDNNPGLAPYRSELGVQAARTRQAGARLDPMIQLKYMNFPVSEFEFDRVMTTQYLIGWSQKYESYGKRGLKRRIAGISEDLTQLRRSQAELEIIQELTDLYYTMASTRARLAVLEDNTALLGLLIELAERKYALGRTPQALVLQAQTRLTKLEEQRINLNAMLSRQSEMLLGLLGHPAGVVAGDLDLAISYPVPVEVEFSVNELLAETLTRRPDLKHLALTRNQQQYKVELAKRSYHPDYTVTASYGVREGDRDVMSAGISFPLFTHRQDRQDAAVQEAYASLDMTDGNTARLTNMLATQLGSLKVELSRIQQLSSLYRDGLVPQARLTLDSSIAGYAANQVDLADLLLAQQTLLSYELELEQLYIDYIAALSELQVVTVGAFDPAPFVVIELGAHQDASASLAPEVSRAIASTDMKQLQPDFIAATRAVEAQQVPRIDPGFLATLGLPDNTPTEPVKEPAPQTTQVEPSSAAEPSSGATDGFYQPFNPRSKDTNDD